MRTPLPPRRALGRRELLPGPEAAAAVGELRPGPGICIYKCVCTYVCIYIYIYILCCNSYIYVEISKLFLVSVGICRDGILDYGGQFC